MNDDTKQVNPAKEAPKAEPVRVIKAPDEEPLYSLEELEEAAKTRFHTMPEVVYTALKLEGLKAATISNTEKLVKEFLEREVK
ncbi:MULTISPECIES: hypothetical protein [unclassified Bilifractor]|uniref:hypothetical protein n=1 Tax=unclassified Bilifractor TaxID=2815795 RepID=UPI003F8D9CC1